MKMKKSDISLKGKIQHQKDVGYNLMDKYLGVLAGLAEVKTEASMVNITELETLARAATPGNFDSAEYARSGGLFECTVCGGEGEVELSVDYCNYDNAAMGVQFYGIGKEFRSAESYYRAANPATMLKLIEIIRAQHAVLKELEEIYGFEWRAECTARAVLAKANEVLGVE